MEDLIVAIEDFLIFVDDVKEKIERNTKILDCQRREYLLKLQQYVEDTKKMFQSCDGNNY